MVSDEDIPLCVENGCPFDQSKRHPSEMPNFGDSQPCKLLYRVLPTFLAVCLFAEERKRVVLSAIYYV